MSAPCKILEWDTDFWGFRVATVTAGDRLDEARVAAIMQWCLERRVRCLYFSADGTCPTTLALAAKHGFSFVDLRVDLERNTQSFGTHSVQFESGHPAVRAATVEDIPKTRRLAGECHTDTRFFKDAEFPRPKAAEMYGRWIDADFARQSLLVAYFETDPSDPVGYVSYSLPSPGRGRIGVIGVAEAHRGRGVAGKLLDAVVSVLRDRGCDHVDVATQASNVGALRLYCRRGFLPSTSRVWYHRWW
jgi:ribosomal protein S18 acetylase RimI-like enzyme